MADDEERQLRRDDAAWATVKRNIEHSAWSLIDKAVADALPTARERNLLGAEWTVLLVADPEPYVITIDPEGQWKLGIASDGGVDVRASSGEAGACNTSMATARRVRTALQAALRG